MNSPILELQQWKAKLSNFHLGPLDLSLRQGRVVALVGPNGAGKSTLLHSLVGLLPKTWGTCRIFGKPRHRDDEDVIWKQQLGFVADHPLLLERHSLQKNAKLIKQHYPTWNQALFESLQQQSRLPMHTAANAVSKGQRMAFALAVVLAYTPRLMLLDEPTAGLDPVNRHFFLDQIKNAALGEQQATVLVSTHILSDVARIADEVCFMKKGRIETFTDRETLTHDWYRVSFQTQNQLGPQSLPGVVKWQQEGTFYQVVTSSFDAFRQHLEGQGITISQANALNLEEVARHRMEV